MNMVIYARYANSSHAEESIECQLKFCRLYANENGHTIICEYMDRNLSGLPDDRPVFQRMVADSTSTQFQAVLVYRTNCLYSNPCDFEIDKAQLERNGVKVISVCENFHNNASGILLEEILTSMANYYSKELSLKIRQGQKRNALNGKANGGIPPFGYILNSKQQYEIDPLTAPIVLDIFTQYADEQTVSKIIKDINSRYVFANTKSKHFTKEYIYSLLRNRRYMGEYRYSDIVIPTVFRLLSQRNFLIKYKTV